MPQKTEANLGPCKLSLMEPSPKIVNDYLSLPIFQDISIIDV